MKPRIKITRRKMKISATVSIGWVVIMDTPTRCVLWLLKFRHGLLWQADKFGPYHDVASAWKARRWFSNTYTEWNNG